MIRLSHALLTLLASALLAGGASAQDRLDRTDPGRQERDLPKLTKDEPADAAVPQPEPEAAPAVLPGVFARDIRLEGAVVLDPALFEPVLRDFRGRRLATDELGALASGVAAAARAAGYPFATARIPAQRLDGGVLRVDLDEGAVDHVRVEPADRGVEALLAPLATGRPVARIALERQLLLAGDLPGVSIVSTRFRREDGRGVLLVESRRRPLRARFGLDNYADDDLGPVRLRGRIDVNGVVAHNDAFQLDAVITPFDPREFQLVGAGYEKGIGASGALIRVDGYVARTRPGGVFRQADTRGESWRAGLGGVYPVYRARHASLWVGGQVYRRESRQAQRGLRIRNDRISAAVVDLAGHVRLGSGYLTGRAAATRGLDLFDITKHGDREASRRDGDARFTKVEGAIAWTGRLAGRFGLKLAAEGQIASRPLLASEEFGIGGPRFLRGYDYSERQGDDGIAGLAELRYDLAAAPRPLSAVQLYAFADAGSVRDLGRRGSESLSSAGGGIRLKLGKGLEADLEVAVPLSGPRGENNSKAPRFGLELRARL